VKLRAVHADLASADQTARLLAECSTIQPLGGVLVAGCTAPVGPITGLTDSGLRSAICQRVHTAWNLHRATAQLPLDFFVLFSTAASVLGPRGHAAEAAAGALLDALARERRQTGRHALSIDWGPWETSEGGVSRLPGANNLPVPLALRALDRLLDVEEPQMMAVDIDWTAAVASGALGEAMVAAELSTAPAAPAEAAPAEAPTSEVVRRLRAADGEVRREVMIQYFVETLVRVMNQTPGRIDPTEPLRSLGLDSLMAIELKSAIESALDISISLGILFQDPSINQLVDYVLDLWDVRQRETAVTPGKKGAAEGALAGR
jgi:acyl carrier protein